MIDLFAFGHIRLNGDYASAIAFNDLHSRLLGVFQTEVCDDDVGTRLSKSPDHRTTDTSRAAGYDYRFIFEIQAHGWFLPILEHIS
jgi:hypothetical protein